MKHNSKRIMLMLVMAILMILAAAPATVFAATFTPRTTAPSTTNKYYIHTSNGGLNQCIEIDTSTGSCLPNCVGYAWGRAYEILGTKPKLSKGNAKNWYSYNKNGGYYSYGSTPKLGAIMCWGGNHVAVVEKIEGNYITISESSYGGARFNVVKRTISQMESRTSDFQGYIYIGDFGSVTPSPMTIRFYPNKGTGTMADVSTTYGSTFTIPECKFVRTGHTFGGWAGYRPSDKTYFVKGVGWVTQEVINEKGYEKRVYEPGESHTLNTSWTKDPIEQNVIGFAAFWSPNFYQIRFDENGASGVVGDTAVQLGETFHIPDAEGLSKPGYEFLYWNAYRTSDNTYYVAGTGWFTEEEIEANGYTKRPYSPGSEYYIDETSWLSSNPANNETEFIFVAVWEEIPATSVSISEESKTVYEGEQFTLQAEVNPSNAPQEIYWFTHDANVATVDANGVVTAKKAGTVAITANSKNGCATSCWVTVLEKPVEEPFFVDVKESDWFYKAVKYVHENKLMSGLTTTHFGPGVTLTREQFATILYRMNGSPVVDVTSIPFNDVPAGTWYTKAVLWANGNKIISGYNATTFGTGDQITREQMAVMMYRYGNHMGYNVSARADFEQFADASKVSTYARAAMQWAVAEGIISGNANGTLNPQGGATRAECASIIMRFDKKY